jgi:cytochrome c oxidase assembly factor CtaG
MHASLEAVVLVPVLAAVYAVALRPRGARAAAATAGLLLIAVFFATPLQGWATETFLWAHLLQNVVMAEWAPLLLVLAIPAVFDLRRLFLGLGLLAIGLGVVSALFNAFDDRPHAGAR